MLRYYWVCATKTISKWGIARRKSMANEFETYECIRTDESSATGGSLAPCKVRTRRKDSFGSALSPSLYQTQVLSFPIREQLAAILYFQMRSRYLAEHRSEVGSYR